MKKLFCFIVFCFSASHSFAQNEARFGVFAGVAQTSLYNSKDAAFGDYLPTFKPTIGVTAGYHFTLFKRMPIGFSAQLASNKMGQNYYGDYADSSRFYAYSRLNYIRPGAALHFGSNPRRIFSVEASVGATYGFLTSYHERYELTRYRQDKFILDIKDNDVIYNDTTLMRGTTSNKLYNATDMNMFGAISFNFLFTRNFVFGIQIRHDFGSNDVENKTPNKINFDTKPVTSTNFLPYQMDVKFRGPVDPNAVRAVTVNRSTGIFLSLKYRLYNPEKIEFWYREHKWD